MQLIIRVAHKHNHRKQNNSIPIPQHKKDEGPQKVFEKKINSLSLSDQTGR
jgi:hypothetical protein